MYLLLHWVLIANDEEKSAKKRFAKKRPDLSRLSQVESKSIESASKRSTDGLAAYNTCISEKFKLWEKGLKRPDLSELSTVELKSIESACNADRILFGPAAYNDCLSNRLNEM